MIDIIEAKDMCKIKMIAIDVDGTLLNSKKELTKKVKDTILRAQSVGIKVVIATGRPLSGIKSLLNELKLANQKDQYVICFGGGVVETTSENILLEKTLTYDDYVDLEAISLKLGLHFHASTPDRIYTANRDIGDYTLYEANLVNLGISYRTPAEMKKIKIVKCMYVDEQELLDHKIADHTPFAHLDNRIAFTKTAPFYYEANPKGVSKGSALRFLCQKLNLTSENLMAIGDEENDLSMIKYAGVGVAMGNAVPAVKQVAQVITEDCDHDGVAKIIEKYI